MRRIASKMCTNDSSDPQRARIMDRSSASAAAGTDADETTEDEPLDAVSGNATNYMELLHQLADALEELDN